MMTDWFFSLTTDVSVLSLALIFALAVCLVITMRVYKQFSTLSKVVSQLQNEYRAVNSGQLGMGRKILEVTEEIANVETVQQQFNHYGTNEKIYEQAGLLLSRGATIEEVVETCEIAPAEAELLAVMNHSAPTHYSKSQQSLAN